MKAIRTLSLAAVLVFGGLELATAAPMSMESGEALSPKVSSVEKVLFCGPYRCFHRGWYGWRRPYIVRRPWGWHRRWGWRRW